MLDIDKAKTELKKLIDDFRENYHNYKNVLEANIETKLVEPLFEILGWTKKDFEKQKRAQRGGKTGHADYAFKIGDKIVFFLEVKRVSIHLEKEADKQVISYALSRRVPFAVSTNFKNLKVFCVEQENAINNVFRVFKYEDYDNKFDDLLFLSKESFEQGIILKKAEDEGRLKRRVSIDKPLLEDLMRIRNMIANDIEKRYPSKYELNVREEIIQRIIDRLIFIRKCEDVGINPEDLTLEEIRHNPYGRAYSRLKYIFKQYHEIYNGGLFAIGIDNDCDKITIDGEIVQKLIGLLYESKDRQYVYNFNWIDADVLGQVYEQYLGKILAQTRLGKSKLKNGQAHRKEQGIYYTPTNIVDYIVSNTLGEILKDKKIDTKKIKVLDPACGSGSFLIKAFDYLNANIYTKKESELRRIDGKGMYSIKTEILKNNIYGVDLDIKAVEITKLNLFLKATEKYRKLPDDVELHIRQGNSLIDDENVVGLDAFKWEDDFQEESFDVVIGNPPWGADINTTEKDYLSKRFNVGKQNINSFELFLKQSITLLKEDGVIGFLIPRNFIRSLQYSEIRREFLENFIINHIIDFKKFPDVTQECVTIIATKKEKNDKNKKNKDLIVVGKDKIIPQVLFLQLPNYVFNLTLDKKKFEILKKLNKGQVLGEIIDVARGEEISKKGGVVKCPYCDNWSFASKKEIKICAYCSREFNVERAIKDNIISKERIESFTPILIGEDFSRYRIIKKHYINRKIKGLKFKSTEIYKSPKLIMMAVSPIFVATFDEDDDIILTKNNYSIRIKKDSEINPKYLLAILNSKLYNFYQESLYTIGAEYTIFISKEYLNSVKILPLSNFDNKQKDIYHDLIKYVDKMLSLNTNLNEIGDKKTSRSARIEEEIRKIDNKIDDMVYKLYGITNKERKIIEQSL